MISSCFKEKSSYLSLLGTKEWNYLEGSPSVPHPSQFNTSVPYKNPSVQHPPQFHSKNPSVQHTPLSSTHSPQFHTKNLSVPLSASVLINISLWTQACFEKNHLFFRYLLFSLFFSLAPPSDLKSWKWAENEFVTAEYPLGECYFMFKSYFQFSKFCSLAPPSELQS